MKPELLIALASVVVSIMAFGLSWSADARAKVAARAQLFLTLRTRFLSVIENLPPTFRDPNWDASDKEGRSAAIRYWHHAFDEWFVTNCLDEKLMRNLWDQYYSEAVLSGQGIIPKTALSVLDLSVITNQPDKLVDHLCHTFPLN